MNFYFLRIKEDIFYNSCRNELTGWSTATVFEKQQDIELAILNTLLSLFRYI